MTSPLSAVAAVASTPAQAKIFVAMLEAEGIPAFVEGDSLADEVAISRRLMNLNGVEVRVPSQSLARAKEVLAASRVDDEELTAAALAATEDAEVAPRSRPAPQPGRVARVVAPVATVAAFVFLLLWQGSRQPNVDALFAYEQDGDGLTIRWRRTGEVYARMLDRDRNGVYEQTTYHGPDRGWKQVQEDLDQDGWQDRTTAHRDGLVDEWTSTNDDGFYDHGVTKDADGRVLQELRWDEKRGFVVVPR